MLCFVVCICELSGDRYARFLQVLGAWTLDVFVLRPRVAVPEPRRPFDAHLYHSSNSPYPISRPPLYIVHIAGLSAVFFREASLAHHPSPSSPGYAPLPRLAGWVELFSFFRSAHTTPSSTITHHPFPPPLGFWPTIRHTACRRPLSKCDQSRPPRPSSSFPLFPLSTCLFDTYHHERNRW